MRGRGPERGVTLVELLVVLGLLAILTGLGISVYLNLGRQSVWQAEVGRLLSTINRVRNSSQSHPAALQIAAGDQAKGEENAVWGVEFLPLFQTQCEPPAEGDEKDVLPGALDRNGRLPGGAKFDKGKIGQCLVLDGVGPVDGGNHPAFDATEGVSISLWIQPSNLRGGTLVSRGPNLALTLVPRNEGLAPRLDLTFAVGRGDPGKGAVSVSEESRTFEPQGVLIPDKEWVRLVVSYDRNAVTMAVDRGWGPVEVLRAPEGSPLAPSRGANLLIGGGGGASFAGKLDDFRMDGVLGSDHMIFAAGIQVVGPSRKVRFLGGRLDPAFHSRPETIAMTSGQRRREITIGLEGNITEK